MLLLQKLGVILGVSISTFLIMYTESKLFDKVYQKTDYFKIILLCNVVVLSTIYILTSISSNGSLPIAPQSNIIGQTKYVPEIGEDMLIRPSNV